MSLVTVGSSDVFGNCRPLNDASVSPSVHYNLSTLTYSCLCLVFLLFMVYHNIIVEWPWFCISFHLPPSFTDAIYMCTVTEQRPLSAIVQARHLSLFGHIAHLPDESDAEKILTASPLENWRRPPGCRRRPHTTWIKTIQQDLESVLNLFLNEAIDLAQNHPLWRLMSTFVATHSWRRMPEMNKWQYVVLTP